MVVPLILVLLAISAVVRVPAEVVWPDQVVDVAPLVDVSVRDAPARRASGAYLTVRRRQRPTVLEWLRAAVPGGADVGPRTPASIDHFDPVESALLIGSGVAPGRGRPEDLGLAAVVRDDHIAAADPAIVLYIADVVSPQDLAAGRRVLVLGGLGSSFTLTCPDDALAAYRSTKPPPDVVVIARDCPDARALRAARAPLLEAASLYDVIERLSRRRGAG